MRSRSSQTDASARSRAQSARAKRAFIAAPLIGTILFLTAVFFSVNLAKVDNAQVTQIASDAYHNRLVSILETYRTDLKSIFTTSLTRSVEGVLTSQCWQTGPFSIRNPNGLAFASPDYRGVANARLSTDGTSASPPLFEEKVERYARCRELSRLVSSNVCSASSGFGLKGWLSNLNVPISFEGLNMEPLNVTRVGSTQTLFQEFLDEINSKLACSDYQHACDGKTGADLNSCKATADSQEADCNDNNLRQPTLCNRLIGDNHLFDCSAFAERAVTPSTSMRCCKPEWFVSHPPDSATGMVPSCTDAQDQLPGCEDGTFFMNIHVTDEQLFPRMPRIQAKDGRGNEIRSGAVADGDLAVHIGYPLFYYYDAAFVMFRPLAYGVPSSGVLSPTDSNVGRYACQQNGLEGVVEGACVGDTATCQDAYETTSGDASTDQAKLFFTTASGAPYNHPASYTVCTNGNSNFGEANQQQAIDKLAQDYASNVLLPSIRLVESMGTPVYRPPGTAGTPLCTSPTGGSSSSVPRLCPKVLFSRSGDVTTFYDNSVNAVSGSNRGLKDLVALFAVPHHAPSYASSSAGWAAYLDWLSLEVHLQDQSPVYQVDPGKPNDYCFQARPQLYQPP